MCKCSVDTHVCHTAMHPGGYRCLLKLRVRDVRLAGPHLSVSSAFLFIHPFKKHLLSTYYASDCCRHWRHSSKQDKGSCTQGAAF